MVYFRQGGGRKFSWLDWVKLSKYVNIGFGLVDSSTHYTPKAMIYRLIWALKATPSVCCSTCWGKTAWFTRTTSLPVILRTSFEREQKLAESNHEVYHLNKLIDWLILPPLDLWIFSYHELRLKRFLRYTTYWTFPLLCCNYCMMPEEWFMRNEWWKWDISVKWDMFTKYIVSIFTYKNK